MKQFLKKITAEKYLMWSAGTLFFAVALTLLAIVFNTAWGKNWDVLSFCGSIIGGVITLLGVRMTILHQNKLEYLKRAPLIRRTLEEIKREVDNSYDLMALVVGYQKINDEPVKEGYFDQKKRLYDRLEKADIVSAELYFKASNFTNVFASYDPIAFEDFAGLNDSNREVVMRKRLDMLQSAHDAVLNQIEKEYEQYFKNTI